MVLNPNQVTRGKMSLILILNIAGYVFVLKTSLVQEENKTEELNKVNPNSNRPGGPRKSSRGKAAGSYEPIYFEF